MSGVTFHCMMAFVKGGIAVLGAFYTALCCDFYLQPFSHFLPKISRSFSLLNLTVMLDVKTETRLV